jgi:outer membrane protein
MKKLLVALLVVVSTSAMAQQKFGHVNSQRLLDTMPSRRAAIETLRKFEIDGSKELEEMQADLEKSYSDYDVKKNGMSPVIQKIEEEKIMRKQQSLQDREQSLNTPILDRIQRAVKIVAERKKLTYVIDETTTLYFAGGIDLTPEVMIELLRLDKEETK